MSTPLPLKIRVDIRDLWDSPKSELQVAIAALAKTLGHKITPVIQWSILHNELKDQYLDNATFVPSISRIVIAWYDRLLWRLDGDKYPEWTEELLGLLPSGQKQLVIEPSPPPHNRPKTSWNGKMLSFYLGIPKVEPLPHTKVVSAFDVDFENLFTRGDGAGGATEDGWDDLAAEPSQAAATSAVPKRTVTTHTVSSGSSERAQVGRIPTIAELPRPEGLFAQQSPYILTLDAGHSLVVRCSHEASLQLIHSYFNRWGRTNLMDSLRRNILKVELNESNMLNGMFDSLTIEPYLQFKNGGQPINPTPILAFIEGVLGYKLVHTDGHNWVYRLDTVLK